MGSYRMCRILRHIHYARHTTSVQNPCDGVPKDAAPPTAKVSFNFAYILTYLIQNS